MAKVANILFPADYFDKKAPDGAMRAEYEAAVAEARLDVGLFDLELFEERGALALTRPFLDESLPLVYRGWMMRPEQYIAFFDALRKKGLRPVTAPDAYDEFHMFPLAYVRHDILNANAPRLVAFPGQSADAEVVNRTFSEFMVKDYVKSVKGTSFPVSFKTPVSQERMDEIVEEFARLRGGLFTAGIVCKEYVDLARYGDATNEWRAFYLGGEPPQRVQKLQPAQYCCQTAGGARVCVLEPRKSLLHRRLRRARRRGLDRGRDRRRPGVWTCSGAGPSYLLSGDG